jgi:trehalose 6-phosphate phosphatase
VPKAVECQKHPEAWALFLDVDGTLLELADSPDRVEVPKGAVDRLKGLNETLRGAMALVSGREISALDKLFAWRKHDAAGCHGAELRVAGTEIDGSDGIAPDIAGLKLEELTSSMPGAWIERKKYATAVHVDHAITSSGAVYRLLSQVLTSHSDAMRLLPGRRVLEVLPVGIDKGTAINRILSFSAYRERKPIFIGDDITDEDGFKEVNQRGGISICVGTRHPTVANFRVQTVAEVHEYLDFLLRHLRGSSGHATREEMVRALKPLPVR